MNMYNTVRRAAVYCRVSTFLGSQEESFQTQCDAYMKMVASDQKLILVDIYGDQGISGTSVKRRPEFQRMINDCRAGKIDIIMTKSISRFSRNLADCMETVRLLRELNIPVIFEREGINTMDTKGEFLLSLLASIAQEEVNSLSLNMRWANDKNNAAGKPTRAPRYGYRKSGDTWAIFEPEAKRVRFAFGKAAEGLKYWQIIEGLNEIELTEGTGIKWTQSRLSNMFTSEVYIGDIHTNKYVTIDYLDKKARVNTGQRPQHYIENHHEPLVSKGQFELVQRRVNNKELDASRGELPEHHRKTRSK